MARVLDPFMSGQARGSLGGITASLGLSGAIIKRKAYPATRVRDPQPRMRSIIGWLSRQWGLLTDAQRQAWKDYAANHPSTDAFGNPFIMSGINAYTMLNHVAVRMSAGAAMNVLPPAVDPPANLWGFAAATGVGNPGEVDLTWTHMGVGVAADFNEIWVAGPFQSPGRVEVANRYAYDSRVAGNILLATVDDLLEGFWYWFRVRYIDLTGQTTAWLYDQATPMLTP